jgi:hypothetical protein
VETTTITTGVRTVVMGRFVKRQRQSHSPLTRHQIRSKLALVTIMAQIMTLLTRRLPHHQVADLVHAVLACLTGDLSHLHLKAFVVFPALRRGAQHHRTDTRVLHLFMPLYPPVLPRPIPTTDVQRMDNDFPWTR